MKCIFVVQQRHNQEPDVFWKKREKHPRFPVRQSAPLDADAIRTRLRSWYLETPNDTDEDLKRWLIDHFPNSQRTSKGELIAALELAMGLFVFGHLQQAFDVLDIAEELAEQPGKMSALFLVRSMEVLLPLPDALIPVKRAKRERIVHWIQQHISDLQWDEASKVYTLNK